MNNLLAIFLLTLLGSVLGLIGGLSFLLVEKWSKFLAKYSVPFAAGVLLTVSLVGLMPEAEHLIGHSVYKLVLFTLVGVYLFESLICRLHHHQCKEDHNHMAGSSLWVIIGDTIHNFIDGVAIAAAYLANPGLGVITAVSTFLHEVPHEIGDFGILLNLGWKKQKIFMVNLLSSLASVIGALLIFYSSPGEKFFGWLIGLSAGMFLYLGASDFLPKADNDLSKIKVIIALLLGVGLMYLTFQIVPHAH
jgi:zinc and cadmium transporter